MSSAARTILVTGFEPFGGETVNASWEAARRLEGWRQGGAVAAARLLPCAYPEGCPTHPSYPAAHAANAGACATILKAFFNEEFVVPRPVEAKADGAALEPWRGRDLTLGGEINKLANNITLGRDAAGVHYRSDGVEGLSIGERQAIGILCDYSRAYNEHFDGFALTRFDGQKVKIANGTVTVA